MPPSAAPEWLRVGCSFEMTATSAPASCASMAARMPAQPAPTTRTSWVASTRSQASGTGGAAVASAGDRLENPERTVTAVESLGALRLRQARTDEPYARAVTVHQRAHPHARRHEPPQWYVRPISVSPSRT